MARKTKDRDDNDVWMLTPHEFEMLNARSKAFMILMDYDPDISVSALSPDELEALAIAKRG